jgi:plastocyanin
MTDMTVLAIERAAYGLPWATVMRVAGAAQVVGLAVAALALGDTEAAAIGIATLVGLVLLRFRGGTLGVIVLGLVFADTAFFTGAAALANLFGRAAPAATIGPGALAALALPGLVATIASLARRAHAPLSSRTATTVAFVAVGALLVLGAISLLTGDGARAAGAEVLRLEVSGARYSVTELSATAGTVTVRVTNHDLFWHTFTIAGLGVDLKLPVGGEQEVTFTAAPGTYTYICSVPGHASFMRGTLTVR